MEETEQVTESAPQGQKMNLPFQDKKEDTRLEDDPLHKKIEDPVSGVSKMKILFLTTAHNSLSQRLFLALDALGKYDISIEFALSPEVMIEAYEMFQPDLIICPFLSHV